MSLERFVITAQPGVLRALLDLLEQDPETAVHTVTRNSQTEPQMLVVSIDPARAVAMASALGSLALIEADDPLPGPRLPFPDPTQPLPPPNPEDLRP